MLDLVTKLNEEEMAKIGDPEIQTTIAQQEMAFRMQASVPDLSACANRRSALFCLLVSNHWSKASFTVEISIYQFSISFKVGVVLDNEETGLISS